MRLPPPLPAPDPASQQQLKASVGFIRRQPGSPELGSVFTPSLLTGTPTLSPQTARSQPHNTAPAGRLGKVGCPLQMRGHYVEWGSSGFPGLWPGPQARAGKANCSSDLTLYTSSHSTGQGEAGPACLPPSQCPGRVPRQEAGPLVLRTQQ